MTSTPQPNLHAAPFHTTRWTRVCLAKADCEDGRRALADLCDAYYEPVVAYLRSVFREADAAREMSHAFFAEMLVGGTIHTAERERGRFRSYLLGAENDSSHCQITFPGDAWAALGLDATNTVISNPPAPIEGPVRNRVSPKR
jgi:hypothetical protein